ncbi:MAG: DnaJ family domain-containing protein, partial [Candidatus Binatia bacterium]
PLIFDDQSWVPEDLRVAYHVLKNAHVLPPEAELMKDIHTLEDLLKYVEDENERKALAKSIQWKIIHLDILKRRSFSMETVRQYGGKLARHFSRR